MTDGRGFVNLKVSRAIGDRIERLRTRIGPLTSTILTTEDIILLLVAHAERHPAHVVDDTWSPPSEEQMQRVFGLPLSTGRRPGEEDIDDDLNAF